MSQKTISLSTTLPCSANTAFNAWLSSQQHGEMTNSKAVIDPNIGGQFNIWDGDIVGNNLEIDPSGFKIVQTWRYSYDDWSTESPSRLTVTFVPSKDNSECVINLDQVNVPEKYAIDIEQGWEEYYFRPMKEYFAKNS